MTENVRHTYLILMKLSGMIELKHYRQLEQLYVKAVKVTSENCDEICTILKERYGDMNVEIHKTYPNKSDTSRFFVAIHFKTLTGDHTLRNNYYLVIYDNDVLTKKLSMLALTSDEFHGRYAPTVAK